MEVILRQDLDDLGLEGDIVNVAKGYARNYLIPKGLALESNPRNLKSLELQRKKIEIRKLKARENAEIVKKQIEGLEIVFKHKAGEEGKLYGSVTRKDISSYLETQGIVVDRKKIFLETPIKELGEFSATIKIYPEITATVNIKVVPEEEG